MTVTHRIGPEDVALGVDADSKHNLLQVLAADAAPRIGRSAEEIDEALRAREGLGATGLGRGVALPHAQLAGEVTPLIRFVRLRRAIDYEARDSEPVDLVILLLWPEADSEGFVPALAEICRALRAPETLRRLRTAGTATEIVELLRSGADPHDRTGDA
jgi:nitrogen PTS system EIIA component